VSFRGAGRQQEINTLFLTLLIHSEIRTLTLANDHPSTSLILRFYRAPAEARGARKKLGLNPFLVETLAGDTTSSLPLDRSAETNSGLFSFRTLSDSGQPPLPSNPQEVLE
jgi:hypothetical protein